MDEAAASLLDFDTGSDARLRGWLAPDILKPAAAPGWNKSISCEENVPSQMIRRRCGMVKSKKMSLAFGGGNVKIAIHGLLACIGVDRTYQQNDKPVFLHDRFVSLSMKWVAIEEACAVLF